VKVKKMYPGAALSLSSAWYRAARYTEPLSGGAVKILPPRPTTRTSMLATINASTDDFSHRLSCSPHYS